MNVKNITSIKKIQKATEHAMSEVIQYLKTSKNPNSETAHNIIDNILDTYHCESPYGHIIASGTQAVEPHNEGSGKIQKGTTIVIDIYPRSKETGFYADMTRTVCIGKASDELRKMYTIVLEAQKLAISMLKPGILCSRIQKSVENYFHDNGYQTLGEGKEFQFKEGFVHGLGHGVSTVLHDSPRIGRGTNDILKEGDIITIEPGLYYEKIGGIRIEDMFLITTDGYETITNFPNQFEI